MIHLNTFKGIQNWCFILWNWRIKILFYIFLWIWRCRWTRVVERNNNNNEKYIRNVNWNDLSFDIYLYNICLEMLRRCRFIFAVIEATDHTAIEIVSRRASWGFVVLLNFFISEIVSFYWLHVHWLLLLFTFLMCLNLFLTAHCAPWYAREASAVCLFSCSLLLSIAWWISC